MVEMARELKFTPGWSPQLDVSFLPDAERVIADKISTHLMILGTYVAKFQSALTLFDFCRTEDGRALERGWKFVAGRDGAMTIWHVGDAMEKIHKALDKRKCPVLVAQCNIDAIREARRLLRQLFPAYEGLRDSVAHSGETAGKIDKHAIRSPYASDNFALQPGAYISESFDERKFLNSFEGKVLSYELSQTSLNDLQKLIALFFSAFNQPENKVV